jgi:esterase FrsA
LINRRVVFLFIGALSVAVILLWSLRFLDEPEDDWYRDIRRGHWIWWGAEESVLDATLTKIAKSSGDRRDDRFDTIQTYGPGNWIYEFTQLGEARRSEAEAAKQAGETEVANKLYHRASVYFGLAKYPGFGSDPNEVYAHQMQLKMYEASQTLNPEIAFSVLEIPVRDSVIRGYLHQPPDRNEPLPLVIGTNGIDVYKAEFGPIVHALVERDISFFAFDMPSAGEEAEFTLKPDNDEIYIEVMRHLQQMSNIDENRIALWGVSFGGNPVVRAAQKSPTGLRAAVNWCGPIHEVFQISESQLGLVADMYLDVMKYRFHMPEAENSALVEAVKGFSLIDAGLIRSGEVTTHVPILSVNAKGDYVAPESDLELVSASTSDGSYFFSGSDDHCPQDRYSASSQTVDWLVTHL